MKYFVLAMMLTASTVFAGEKANMEVLELDVMDSPRVDLIGFKSKHYKVDGGVLLRSNIIKWCIDGYVWYQSGNGDIIQAERHVNYGSNIALVECKNNY